MSCVQGGALKTEKEKIIMSLESILKAVDGKMLSNVDISNLEFSGVSIDSRKVEKDFLFFALVGTLQDGHDYIGKAIENGASCVFINESYLNSNRDKINDFLKQNVIIICVTHTMYALQNLAKAYVLLFPNLIRVGITGSSGKTTTKEIAVKVISQKYKTIYNEGNLNSETGLPLSVFNIRKEHEVGIFEMGMNRQGEILELAKILRPQYAIITNVGTAHIGILKSRLNIAKEKRQIFHFFNEKSVGYIPEDDDFSDFLFESEGNIKKISFDLINNIQNLGLKGTLFEFDGKSIKLALCGKYNLKNTLPVIQLAKDLKLTTEQIKNGIESVEPIFGRNQIFEEKITVIQDCYNANPDSMASAIDFADSVKFNGKKIFILADMLELGSEEDKEHEKIAKQVKNSGADAVFFLGKLMSKACKKVDFSKKQNIFAFESTDEKSMEKILEKFMSICNEGDLVFLKGSRGMALERLSKMMLMNFAKNGNEK
ncbi:MAG: UDP-N-acetylmuramoyl-tripeptide--D-alanyl-D-alanine ligase [Treponemataceae bacterium]